MREKDEIKREGLEHNKRYNPRRRFNTASHL